MRWLDLPGVPENGGDFSDYRETHSAEDFRALLAQAMLFTGSSRRASAKAHLQYCASPKLCTIAESMTWRSICLERFFAMIP